VKRVECLATVGVAVATLLLAASAHAQETPPLSASPATVTLDANGNGEVTLSNNLGVDLELTLEVVGEDGARVPSASVDPSDRSLVAGSSATVTVRIPGPPRASILVVVAAPVSGLSEGAALRIPVSKTAPAKPAVKEWTLVYTHAGDDAGTRLPLTSACAGLGLKKATELGTVQAGGEQLAITGSCDGDSSKSVTLTTAVQGSDGRSYKGKIKVGDSEVDLTVEDTLSWMLVALLIAIGIGAAVGVSAWQGWGRATRELLRKSYLVEQLVASRNERNADVSFVKAAADLGLPANVQAWTIAGAVRTKVSELRRPLRRFPTDDEVTQAGEELDALELEIRQWPDTANRLGELKQRLEKLADLKSYLDIIEPRTLCRPGPLSLEAMRDVRAAADEAVALANDWPAASIEAARGVGKNLPANEPARLHLDSVLERFRTATSPALAKAALDEFWEVDRELREAAVPPALRAAAMPEAGGPALTGRFEQVDTDDPALAARGLATQIWMVDMWVFVVLLLAALIAGMQALWVDKSFGGAWDIASAFVWGLGAGAVGEPLSAALGDLGRSWFTTRDKA
jgi:hypothetical protein